MNVSKTFVLVVGSDTKSLRAGSCAYENCSHKMYSVFTGNTCLVSGKTYSTQSYVDYECELALKAYNAKEMRIVVLYNSSTVDRSKCPEALRYVGTHVEMKSFNWNTGHYDYDYNKVKKAIEGK